MGAFPYKISTLLYAFNAQDEVLLMERLQEAIKALDLKITRWDGAGAIAGALNAQHK